MKIIAFIFILFLSFSTLSHSQKSIYGYNKVKILYSIQETNGLSPVASLRLAFPYASEATGTFWHIRKTQYLERDSSQYGDNYLNFIKHLTALHGGTHCYIPNHLNINIFTSSFVNAPILESAKEYEVVDKLILNYVSPNTGIFENTDIKYQVIKLEPEKLNNGATILHGSIPQETAKQYVVTSIDTSGIITIIPITQNENMVTKAFMGSPGTNSWQAYRIRPWDGVKRKKNYFGKDKN